MKHYNLRNPKVKALLHLDIIDYLTDDGWGRETARAEVNTWYYKGMKALTPTPRKAITKAIKALEKARLTV